MGIGLAEATPGLSCSNCSLGWWHPSVRGALRTGPGLTEQDFPPPFLAPPMGLFLSLGLTFPLTLSHFHCTPPPQHHTTHS